MQNVFDTLQERGFIQQMTHEDEIKKLLAEESVTFYIGFDPTADSMTIGHFIQIMAMMHMQKAGHRPLVLIGGGTGLVGDPTDKSDMRRLMFNEEIKHNCDCFAKQFSRFLDFEDGKAVKVNNADWLAPLNYVEFLREVGVHFSVNKMLAADCYKTRYERGLTFLEFNYMLMQSFDFLELRRKYNCKLQLGGNDQWSNIIGGVELIRRSASQDAYGMTFSLITRSDGVKMGKSMAGAVWLDPAKTSPYEFFQYLRNIPDADVKTFLCLLTFLPMDEVNRLSALPGNEINQAKEALAYECAKIVHGQEEADKALAAAKALFSGAAEGGSIPATEIGADKLGLTILDLMELCGLVSSRSEGRRLITQGGVSVNNQKADAFDMQITAEHFKDGKLMIQKGKKVFHQVQLV